jgi:hypothetical protein
VQSVVSLQNFRDAAGRPARCRCARGYGKIGGGQDICTVFLKKKENNWRSRFRCACLVQPMSGRVCRNSDSRLGLQQAEQSRVVGFVQNEDTSHFC